MNEIDLKSGSTVAKIDPAKQVGADFFRTHISIGRSFYLDKRNNCARFRLKTAQYLIIPTTFKNYQEASYMLRILISRSEGNKQNFKKKSSIIEVEGFTPGIQNNLYWFIKFNFFRNKKKF